MVTGRKRGDFTYVTSDSLRPYKMFRLNVLEDNPPSPPGSHTSPITRITYHTPITYYPSPITHHITHHQHHPLPIIHHTSPTTRHPTRHPSHVTHQTSPITCHPAHVIQHTPPITCHPSYITHHTSPITCHPSHITHDINYQSPIKHHPASTHNVARDLYQ